MPPQLRPEQPGLAAPLETPNPGPTDENDSEVENHSPFLAMDTACPTNSEPLPSPMPLTTQNLEDFEETLFSHKKESDYEPSISPRSELSNESAFLPTFSRRKVRTRSIRAPRRQSMQHVLASPYVVPSESMVDGPAIRNIPIDYGTPVLDAHRGIELSELKAKAERYRDRNQG
jgi:hypothetical protein